MSLKYPNREIGLLSLDMETATLTNPDGYENPQP